MSIETLSTAFQSERLSYRAFENNEDDKKFLSTYIENDPTVAAFAHLSLLKPRNKQATETLAETIFKSTMAVMVHVSKPVVNTENSTPAPIGIVVLGAGGLHLDNVHNRSIEFGILLAKPYQNQGYGQEATNWALDWAFRFGGFHRVELKTMSHNERAQHVYKKLGFVEEGRARESHWHDRKWYDMVSFGILEREWVALRGLTES
ncbi:acyl-CoA N-acyltransferase [Dactylonectria estremocensis]|uniref:Acyl-CoA N-acyltransferase n=1 Tax=Dactylonectria estremocensis TaxID=1079267 RepID=A0A9P9IPF8_9HYPO|nr:acyl-CoA N-acyltransferase [Dactylonectria estremocensis]